jgi:hypothetical protein
MKERKKVLNLSKEGSILGRLGEAQPRVLARKIAFPRPKFSSGPGIPEAWRAH